MTGVPLRWRRRPLWNGLALYNRRPALYIGGVVLAPPAAAALVVGWLASWWLAPVAFALALLTVWIVQYRLLI